MSTLQLLFLIGCAFADDPTLEPILAPAPESPNCVLTKADPSDSTHYIKPISFTGSPDIAWDRLHDVVMKMPRVTLSREDPMYRHYVFTTGLFRFKDDVQFVLHPREKLIHFRSASRTGYSDLGVNRNRMEKIRAKMAGY